MPRPIFDYRTTSTIAWDSFKQEFPKLAKKIGKTLWVKILRDMNFSHFTYMEKSGNFIKLPFGLSKIGLTKYKRVVKKKNGKYNLPIDWKRTKEEKKVVYLVNNHSDGYRVNLFWNRGTAIYFPFCKYLKINLTRKNNRHLADFIQNSEDPNKIERLLYNPYKKFIEDKYD